MREREERRERERERKEGREREREERREREQFDAYQIASPSAARAVCVCMEERGRVSE